MIILIMITIFERKKTLTNEKKQDSCGRSYLPWSRKIY